MNVKEKVCSSIEAKRNLYSEINDKIWSTPEYSFREYKSAQVLIDALKENGFQVESDIAGMPTAFKAVYGIGKPVIGFLAEYDALAGLSQVSAKPEKCPVEEGGNGHGCGHNAIGTSCVAAAVAMKEAMEENGTQGTVIVFGCPAEENGGGKCFMARDGVFDGVDVAFAPHPASGSNTLLSCSTLANVQVEYSFKGVASHASGMPEMGRSALDAADLMIVGVQFLREHIIQEARIHHAYLDVGGTSPNVVQDSAKLLFYIRAPKAEQVMEIFERVNNVARGAALMTDTKVTINHLSGLADYVPSDTIGQLTAESWAEIGACEYSEEAKKVAEIMAPTVGKTTDDVLLSNNIPKYVPVATVLAGSSDVGDVSYRVPTTFVNFEGVIAGTPGHSWQMVAQTGTPIMHDGLIHAAKVMANAGMKIMNDPSVIEKAKEELQKKTGGKVVSMLSEYAKPGF